MDAKKLYDTEVLIHKLKSLVEAAPNAFGIGAVKDTLEGAQLYREKILAELTKKYKGKHCMTSASNTSTPRPAKIVKAVGADERSIIMEVEYTDQEGWDYRLLSQLTLQE